MTATYTVTAEHTPRGWWVLECPELGAVSQVRKLNQVEEEMREAIAYLAHTSPDQIHLQVEVLLPQEYHVHAQTAAEQVRLADQARAEAAKEIREAAKVLRENGLTLREIGQVMGISHQRAQQLLSEAA